MNIKIKSRTTQREQEHKDVDTIKDAPGACVQVLFHNGSRRKVNINNNSIYEIIKEGKTYNLRHLY